MTSRKSWIGWASLALIACAPVAVVSQGAAPEAKSASASASASAFASPSASASGEASASASAPASASASASASAEASASASASAPAIPIKKGSRVLMFGDSMVTTGLGMELREHILAAGGTFHWVTKPSSTSASWSEGHELDDLLARVRPDIVLVVLVSNELFIPAPRARAWAIRHIVKRVGPRECIWIGPPKPWLPEKGILGVLRENVAPCRLFESTELDLERQKDGIHPSPKGGKEWGSAVWRAYFAEP